MRQILMVVHQETSNPGLVGQVLQEWGYALDIRCPAIGQPLPTALDAYEGIIVFGGPMSANDDDTLPFIRQEMDWIAQVLEAEKPYLGICLGAQMLARALGAQVVLQSEDLREIGYFPLHPTAPGREFFTEPMHVYQWHKEGFELPSECTLLAEGDLFPNQAFRYGKSAFGIQFHPEITAELIEHWTSNAADQLLLPGAQARPLHFHQHKLYSQAVENWLRRFLWQWLYRQPAIAPDWSLSA
ncbi:gamma-glutamyl-gamma-aminobutyrate hydrolase family protein [Pseudanabaena sp. FACHB-2040]|nr:gamma-glutamyl-gamma-aminobutyrate hydrolase family protein [Pseudanabaena sp. FACHB-2040]